MALIEQINLACYIDGALTLMEIFDCLIDSDTKRHAKAMSAEWNIQIMSIHSDSLCLSRICDPSQTETAARRKMKPLSMTLNNTSTAL